MRRKGTDRRARCQKLCRQTHLLPSAHTGPSQSEGELGQIWVQSSSSIGQAGPGTPQKPHLTWFYRGRENCPSEALCLLKLPPVGPHGPTQADCGRWASLPLSLSKPGPGARQAVARGPRPPHQACWERQLREHTALTVW